MISRNRYATLSSAYKICTVNSVIYKESPSVTPNDYKLFLTHLTGLAKTVIIGHIYDLKEYFILTLERKIRQFVGYETITANNNRLSVNYETTWYWLNDFIGSQLAHSINANFAEYSAHSNSTKFLTEMLESETQLLLSDIKRRTSTTPSSSPLLARRSISHSDVLSRQADVRSKRASVTMQSIM